LNNGAYPLNAPGGEDAQTRRNKRRPASPRSAAPAAGTTAGLRAAPPVRRFRARRP